MTSLLCRGLFRLSGRLGNGGNKARGSWEEGKRYRAGDAEKGKEKARSSPAPPIFFFNFPVISLFSPFSRRFPTEGASAEERAWVYRRGGQSIKIGIGKQIDKSISIDKLKLNVIDFIDQSIEIDAHTLGSFNFIDFIGFIIIYQS